MKKDKENKQKKGKTGKVLKRIGISVASVCLIVGLIFGGLFIYSQETRPAPVVGTDIPVGQMMNNREPTGNDLSVLENFILKNYYENAEHAGFIKNDFIPSYYQQYYLYRLLKELGADADASAFLERIRPTLAVNLSTVKENKFDPINFCFYLYLCAEAGVEISNDDVTAYLHTVTGEDGLVGSSAEEITTAYYLDLVAPKYDLSEFSFGARLAEKAAETQFLPYTKGSSVTFYNAGGAVLYACGRAGIAEEAITPELRDWLAGWTEYYETYPDISVVDYRNYLDVKCLFAPVTEAEQVRLQSLYDKVADMMEEGDIQGLYHYVSLFHSSAGSKVRERAISLSETMEFGDKTISIENTFYGFLLNKQGVNFNSICTLNYEKIRNVLPLFLQSAQEDVAAKKYASAIKKVYYTAYLDFDLSSKYFTGKTPWYEEGQTETYHQLIKALLKKVNSLSDEEWIECVPLLCRTATRMFYAKGGVSRYYARAYGKRLKKIYKNLQTQPDSIWKVRFYRLDRLFPDKYSCGDFTTEMADIYEVLLDQPAGIRIAAGDGSSADIYSTFTYLTAYYAMNNNNRLFDLMYSDRGLDVIKHCRAFAENLYKESGILFPAEPGGIPTLRSVYEGLYLYLR